MSANQCIFTGIVVYLGDYARYYRGDLYEVGDTYVIKLNPSNYDYDSTRSDLRIPSGADYIWWELKPFNAVVVKKDAVHMNGEAEAYIAYNKATKI